MKLRDAAGMPVIKISAERRKSKRYLNLWCWGFMLPSLISYALFSGWPIIASVYYAMLNWSGMSYNATFIGLGNFVELLSDQMYWNAFFNSFKYTLIIVPLEMVVSLFLAYMLNDPKLKGSKIYRTLYFLPVVTTAAIIGIIMVFIWGSKGPVNEVLKSVGILSKPISWLGNSKYAMFTVALISLWKGVGISMIYWLAGLQSVSRDMYEAAEIDGASKARTFFSIVLPLILPIGGIILILCIINSLKVFDIIKTLTDGGPFYATDVVGTFVYRTAFAGNTGMPRLGYASAAALLFGATVIVIGVALNVIKNKLHNKTTI